MMGNGFGNRTGVQNEREQRMADLQTYRFGSCVAIVDVITGNGMLAYPDPETSPVDPFGYAGATLADAELNAAIKRLISLGIVPTEGESGGFSEEPPLPDGSPVVGLYVLDPVQWVDGLDDIDASLKACRRELEDYAARAV